MATKYGASFTDIINEMSDAGALSAFGGKENLGAAMKLAQALNPQPEPVDPALLSFLFFSKMAEEASKPGSTALGAAGTAAATPAAYLMQKRKEDRAAQSAIPTTALSLAKLMKPDASSPATKTKPFDVKILNEKAFSTAFPTAVLPEDKIIALRADQVALLSPGSFELVESDSGSASAAKAPKPYFVAEDKLNELNKILGTTLTRSPLGNVLLTPEQFAKGQSVLGQEAKPSPKGSQYERIQSNVNRIGLLLANPDTAAGVSAEDKLTYLQDYQKLIAGGEYTVFENGKEITKFLPGIDLTNSDLPVPEGLDMEKIIQERSQKFDQVQSTAATFGSRMLYNEGILRNVIAAGYELSVDDIAQIRVMSFLGLGSIGVSPEAQQFHVAAQNWVAAQLRQESGAAIAASEYADALLQYFPQVGDDLQTKNNKRALREQATRGMINASGEAFNVMYPFATPYLTYTSDGETYEILNPQGYANERLAKNKLGIDLFFKETIKSWKTDTLAEILANKNSSNKYTAKQMTAIGAEYEKRQKEM